MKKVFVIILLFTILSCKTNSENLYGWTIKVYAESQYPNIILNSDYNIDFWTCKVGCEGTTKENPMGVWVDNDKGFNPRIGIDILDFNLPANITDWSIDIKINFTGSEIFYGKREAIYFLPYNIEKGG